MQRTLNPLSRLVPTSQQRRISSACYGKMVDKKNPAGSPVAFWAVLQRHKPVGDVSTWGKHLYSHHQQRFYSRFILPERFLNSFGFRSYRAFRSECKMDHAGSVGLAWHGRIANHEDQLIFAGPRRSLFSLSSASDSSSFDPWKSRPSANLLKQNSDEGLSLEEKELRECLHEYQRHLQAEDPKIDLEVLDQLYCAYMALEFWEEALQVEETKCQQWFEVGTDDYADSMHNQGKLWLRQGDFDRSKPLYEQALEFFQQTQNQVQEGHVLISLAGWYFFQHERFPSKASSLDTAMEHLRKAELLLDANPTLLVKCLDNQGLICRSWGDFEGALDKYEQALQVVVDDATRQALYFHLADMHVALENPLAALDLYQELLNECQQQTSKMYGDAVISNNSTGMQGVLWHNIATIHVQMGEYDLAEDEFRKALHWKRESAGSEEHPELAKTWNSLGALYFGVLDEKRQALECFRNVLWVARANSDYVDHASDPEVLAALQTISDIEEQIERQQ